jgi:hypothetical protein
LNHHAVAPGVDVARVPFQEELNSGTSEAGVVPHLLLVVEVGIFILISPFFGELVDCLRSGLLAFIDDAILLDALLDLDSYIGPVIVYFEGEEK